ncbi:MAG TPA: hypothetical protein VHW23_04045 [Kofleriaceae bacterium]|nr:hypothetical protein [Kofleriaceae bacterium]
MALGCTASGADVQPPRDQLAFPTGMAAAPDNSVLFVANANSELRYDSGSLAVIDLARTQSVIDAWLAHIKAAGVACDSYPGNVASDPMVLPPQSGGGSLSCSCDSANPGTLICDEAYFLNQSAGVRIGNFATGLSIQDFTSSPSPKLRVFVPTRGDPSLAWADYDGTALHCNSGSGSYALCDDAHRLISLNNDSDAAVLPDEPFSVFADVVRAKDTSGNDIPPTHGFAMVAHLSNGAVTLIDAPADSTQVQITDIATGVFPDPTGTGAFGATTVSGRQMTPAPPGPPPEPGEGVPELVPDMMYVAGNTDNRVQLFNVGMRGGSAAYLLPSTFFVLDAVGGTSGSSGDTRGLQFSADFSRLYLVNRSPPSLQVYDTSIGPTGTPSNALLGSSDLCRQATAAAVAGNGLDERVYVTCFEDGQIYVVNPFGQSQVEDIISVGRGPYAAVTVASKKQLFVSNFLEDTIAAIDIDPMSPTHNRVVLRIGTPSTP